MKILGLEIANIKRVKAIHIVPTDQLVKITGANGQGKTSILDAIMWALVGGDAIQSQPIRQGEDSAVIRVKLGTDQKTEYLVQRKFTKDGPKTGYIEVRTADGVKLPSPQAVLNAIIGALSFDPISFMDEKPADQLATLRRLVVLTDEKGETLDIDALDKESATAFRERTDLNRDQKAAQNRADAIEVPDNLPAEEPSTDEIMQRMNDAQAANRKVDQHEGDMRVLVTSRDQRQQVRDNAKLAVERAQQALADAESLLRDAETALTEKQQEIDTFPAAPERVDTNALVQELAVANALRDGFKARTQKIAVQAEANALKAEADEKTARIDEIAKIKADAIARAKMPVPGLSFGDGMVLFDGLPLDQASDATKLRVSIAIAANLNPTLRVLRVRDANHLDSVAMAAMEQFGKDNDFQIWAEIVEESGNVGIVIEDGGVRGQDLSPETVLNRNDKPAKPAATVAPAAEAAPPSEERQQAAKAFLEDSKTKLAEVRKDAVDGREQVEALHARVKVKLKAFPDMIAQDWNPVYLEKLGSLKPKRAAE